MYYKLRYIRVNSNSRNIGIYNTNHIFHFNNEFIQILHFGIFKYKYLLKCIF